jgi:hypothetical protein
MNMKEVYVLSHGRTSIAHRFGASNFDSRQIMAIYDSEEKVFNHILNNVKNRVDALSAKNRFDEYPTIEKIEGGTKLIYARSEDDRETEFQYYIYERWDVE